MTVYQQQRTVNIALAIAYEEAVSYAAKALDTKLSRRDQLTFRALSIQAVRFYNRLLLTLAPLGSSNLAREAKLEMSLDFKIKLESISELEIREMTDLVFGTTKTERERLTNKQLEEAIGFFNKHPEKLASLANAMHNIGRNLNGPQKIGDAQKGGIVRHLVHDKGMGIEEARERAEDQIIDAEAQKKLKNKEGISGMSRTEINTILVEAGEKPIIQKASDYSNKDELLSLLTPAAIVTEESETCPPILEPSSLESASLSKSALETEASEIPVTVTIVTEPLGAFEAVNAIITEPVSVAESVAEPDFGDFDTLEPETTLETIQKLEPVTTEVLIQAGAATVAREAISKIEAVGQLSTDTTGVTEAQLIKAPIITVRPNINKPIAITDKTVKAPKAPVPLGSAKLSQIKQEDLASVSEALEKSGLLEHLQTKRR